MDILASVVDDLRRSVELEEEQGCFAEVYVADCQDIENGHEHVSQDNFSNPGDNAVNGPAPKRRRRKIEYKKRQQRYLKDWESIEGFSSWLTSSKNQHLAYCRACKSTILARLASIKEHASSKKHWNNMHLQYSNDPVSCSTLDTINSESTCDSPQESIMDMDVPKRQKKRSGTLKLHGQYDLCIIGGGMFGSAAARHASANPLMKVCLVGPKEPTPTEWKERKIFGAHYDEGRIVCDVHRSGYVSNVLSKHSIERFRDVERLSGIKFFNKSEALHIMTKNDAKLKTYQQSCEPTKSTMEELDEEDFQRRYPYLHLDFNECGQAVYSNSGYISARKFVAAQQHIAEQQGCHIVHDVVEEVQEFDQGFHTIETEKYGVIHAKRVLITTGAFTNFKNLLHDKLDMRLSKESYLMLRISREEAIRLKAMPPIMFHRSIEGLPLSISGVYILPPIMYPDGNYYLKVGPDGFFNHSKIKNLDDVNQWYNSAGFEHFQPLFKKLLTQLIPGLEVENMENKTCITSDSPTGLPYIDRVTPTVTVAVFGNGHGACLSEEVGRIAAELSVTGKWDSDLSKTLFECIFEDDD